MGYFLGVDLLKLVFLGFFLVCFVKAPAKLKVMKESEISIS